METVTVAPEEGESSGEHSAVHVYRPRLSFGLACVGDDHQTWRAPDPRGPTEVGATKRCDDVVLGEMR